MNTTKLMMGITIALFIASTLFKQMHWPGASVMYLAAGLCGIISAFLTWRDTADTGDSSAARWGIVLLVLPMILFPLFRIMHWEGAMIAAWLGIAYLVLFPLSFIFSSEERSPSRNLLNYLFTCLICLTCMLSTMHSMHSPMHTDEMEGTSEHMEEGENSEPAESSVH